MSPKLLLIYFIHSVSANYDVFFDHSDTPDIIPRCSDRAGVTFTAAEGYIGRYIAELCTEKNNIRAQWTLNLRFFRRSDNCNAEMKSTEPGTSHSFYSHWVSSDHGCIDQKYVCMSTPFDMIFGACYYMHSSFDNNIEVADYFNISNPYTRTMFENNNVTVDAIVQDEYVSVTWHTGLPPSEYNVKICNATDLEQESCELVSNCSVVMKTTIKCYLNPPRGRHVLWLHNEAPWINGIYAHKQNVAYHLNVPGPVSRPVVAGGWAAWRWWAAGGALALAAAAAGALAAARVRAAARRQKEVLRRWLVHDNGEAGVDNAKPEPCRHVLLLYARECAAATRAIDALKVALEHVIEGQVYDVFSPSAVAVSAAAPAEWVRGTLRRRDLRVLLLQSPALRLLHAPGPAQDDTHLVSPLLGRRVVPRVPQFGDALLQYALRLATEDLHAAHNYNKYYVATLSALPTEILPCLVPYRRFPLPAATPLLLKALSNTDPDPQHIDNFTLALKEFTDYANENKDYIMDEFMFIDD